MRVGHRERELVWDEIAARKVAEERLAELIPALNDLASAREAMAVMEVRIASLEAELAHTQRRAQAVIDATEHALAEAQHAQAREAQAHADTRTALAETTARLAYRESLRGWLRYPLAATRRREGA